MIHLAPLLNKDCGPEFERESIVFEKRDETMELADRGVFHGVGPLRLLDAF